VFDDQGTFLREFGEPGADPGGFVHATGIAVDAEGSVYVADFDAERVQRFDADGVFESEWRNPGAAGSFQTPEGLAVDFDGTVIVTSYRNGEIQLLPETPGDSSPWPVVAGARGFGEGLFLAPVDVAVAPDGSVYVSDQSSNMVQRFVRNG
jgi:DNA-binding beta-propeller fold protein YncE